MCWAGAGDRTAEGAYRDAVTLVRLEEYRQPNVSIEAMRTLQRLSKTQNPNIGDNLVDASVSEKLYAEYGVK